MNDRDGPLPADARKEVVELPDGNRIESARRLVEDEQVGIGQEGLGEVEPLAHPLGVSPHAAVADG